MEAKILGQIIIKLFKEGRNELIDRLVENFKNEGKFYLLKDIIEYLRFQNFKMNGYEPAKLLLAFDYDEDNIKNLIKDKFDINIEVIKKDINSELILGGRLIMSNYLIDFSLQSLINKIFSKNQWKT
jgi:F0F1-type ATP synthase delta subunit